MTSAEDLKDARAAFLAWDTNKDGVLTEDEITAHMDEICQYFRLERPNVQKMLKGASISGKGKVNYNEFVTAAFDKKRLLSAENLRKAFALFDREGKGYFERE